MTLPVYMKPIEMKQVDADNSRALYRNAEPFLKKCLSTANLKGIYFNGFGRVGEAKYLMIKN